MGLIVDLLVGIGKRRYLQKEAKHRDCMPSYGPLMRVVFLPASIAAFCLMHIFWRYRGLQTVGKVGAVACPPIVEGHPRWRWPSTQGFTKNDFPNHHLLFLRPFFLYVQCFCCWVCEGV